MPKAIELRDSYLLPKSSGKTTSFSYFVIRAQESNRSSDESRKRARSEDYTPIIKRPFSIHIGSKVKLVDESLFYIVDAINESRFILDLKFGWDEMSAKPISKEVWEAACIFLIDYATAVFHNGVIIDCPEINPCSDGSVDLAFRGKDARLLINFSLKEGDGISASYYGDFYENRNSIKGNVDLNRHWEHLSSWMENLSK